MYQAVVFDVDGTIVDTTFLVDAAAEAYRVLRSKELTSGQRSYIYGAPSEDTIKFLGIENRELMEFNLLFRHYMGQFISRQKLFDGICSTMRQLKEQGIMIGINTSRTADEVRQVASTVGEDFTQYCDLLITCDIVANPKPAPDSLLLFSEKTGVSLDKILFLGDTFFDSGCAENAGCDFALATWGTNLRHPAKYYPEKPEDILSIVTNS